MKKTRKAKAATSPNLAALANKITATAAALNAAIVAGRKAGLMTRAVVNVYVKREHSEITKAEGLVVSGNGLIEHIAVSHHMGVYNAGAPKKA